MADNLPNTIENQVLDALVGVAPYSVTTPIRLALMTANGNETTAGTEVTGGSYARQAITFNAASGGSMTNSAVINFTGMPACTVVGIEIYDSAGTPKRIWYGPLQSNKTVASGDTLQFGASAITLTIA